VEQGYAAARACTLTQLAVLRGNSGRSTGWRGDLGERLRQRRVGFAESPAIINGASDLLVEVFGRRAAMFVPPWCECSATQRTRRNPNDSEGEGIMTEHALAANPTHSV